MAGDPPVDVAAAILSDGFGLLLQNGWAGRRIASMGFSNPFPAALRAPPARGGALWWDEGRTFVTAKLTPEMALGDAEVVMVPKLWWSQSITTALMEAVQPRLQEGFTPHESRYWTAWVRNPAAQ